MPLHDLTEKINIINEIYDSLSDQESKDIFDMRIDYFMYRDAESFIDAYKKYVTPSWGKFHGFEEFYRKKMKQTDSDIPIIIVPAGDFGEKSKLALEMKGYKVDIFADNYRCGDIDNIPIVKVSEINNQYTGDYVCILSVDSKVVKRSLHKQLLDSGVPEENIFIVPFGSLLINNNQQYFDSDIVKRGDEEIFLDCGSCDGITSIGFERWAGSSAKKIIALEPFDDAFRMVQENLKDSKCEIELHKVAAWNKETELKFKSDSNLGSTAICSTGDITVKAQKIDDILNGQKITFLKMDIEGSELAALQGAENTIRLYKPKLAICIYHKPEDIIDIPYYIYSLQQGYKFYIRHYAYPSTGETVLYCL